MTLNLFRYAAQLEEVPERYRKIPTGEIEERTAVAKDKLGKAVLILGHNYQNDAIIQFSDYTGDSYLLSKRAASADGARYIVFCGVSFMAESADILTDDSKKVILPSMHAACPMAGMAELVQVEKAWKELARDIPEEAFVPITYMNSYADLKAFCARHGGAVCTSSNAPQVFRWAREQEKKILFFPDEHLGRNTADKLGITDQEMVVWNPWRSDNGDSMNGAVRRSRVILWKGHCQVHQRFTLRDVQEARARYPNIHILVHPECIREVVQAADEDGSTEYIIRTVEESPAGTAWAIGTEFHLVNRLKNQNPDKFITPLGCEVCIDCNAMRQINPANLLWVLEALVEGQVVNHLKVDEDHARLARLALDRMLTIH